MQNLPAPYPMDGAPVRGRKHAGFVLRRNCAGRSASLAVAMVLASVTLSGGQGVAVVGFDNTGASPEKRIWVNNTGNVGDGMLASGSAYSVALYWGPESTTDERALVQVGSTTPCLTGSAAGTFSGGRRTITSSSFTVNGPVLSFQVRAWQSAAGASYEQALINSGYTGKGPIFDLDTVDPADPLDQHAYVDTAPGYRGFAIIVPEPSAIALVALAATALLLFRRRAPAACCAFVKAETNEHAKPTATSLAACRPRGPTGRFPVYFN